MDPIKDYDEIATNDFPKLLAGGYVIKILEATDNLDKKYFELIFDIAEGEKKGFFGTEYYADKDYAHKLLVSYKESAKKSFKGFLTSVEKSNDVLLKDKAIAGTLAASDLKGKLVGAILSYEEYESDNGDIRQRLKKFADYRAVDTIRSGDFRVPELKKLKVEVPEISVVDFSPITDEECPF